MLWKKVAIVGVGLLGGSLGLALRKNQLVDEVVGFVRRRASVGECERFGAVDRATLNLENAVKGAELIVLCTPLGQMKSLVRRMLPCLLPGALVTDVGSAKDTLVHELEPMVHAAGAWFVGGHPMAGSEKTGVSAARPDLYLNAVCALTPTRNTNKLALRKIERLWNSIGSRVIMLPPDVHDQFVCRSSHLPYVLASGLANYVLASKAPTAQAKLCGSGFRDMTRIASGSPEMWRDIAVANRSNLLQAIEEFSAQLRNFKQALKNGDGRAFARFFAEAKQRRDRWSAQMARPRTRST